jgi:carbonic anhydrase/acetyltransferase-like protein (isoleucine patch superfamily)
LSTQVADDALHILRRVILEHAGRAPTVDPSAYVAPNAVVSGDVTVGPGARVLFGAVLTAEAGGAIALGANSIVMEQAVVRGRTGYDARIGDHVLIGPHAHVNGCDVGDGVFVATGASIFPGARVGAGAEIRIGAVLQVNSSLPAGATVPIGWVAVGDPAEAFPPERHDEIWAIQRELDFPGTVFGLPRAAPMSEAMARYSELFGAHRDDRVVE